MKDRITIHFLIILSFKRTEANFKINIKDCNISFPQTNQRKLFCIQITFNNPLKAFFSNKIYLITIQIRPTQILKVYFFLKNRNF